MRKLIGHFIEALFGGRRNRGGAPRGSGGGQAALPKHEMFFYCDLLLSPLL